MSLYIEFEPHSWYKGFAIKKDNIGHNYKGTLLNIWLAVTANGMTGYVDELTAPTLKDLKQRITDYRAK